MSLTNRLPKYHMVPMDRDYLNNIVVTISIQQQGRRKITQIVGLNKDEFDVKSISSKLKALFSCGGSIKEDKETTTLVIGFQGDFRVDVKDFLVKNNIKILRNI